jgi:hypothetical protein
MISSIKTGKNETTKKEIIIKVRKINNNNNDKITKNILVLLKDKKRI